VINVVICFIHLLGVSYNFDTCVDYISFYIFFSFLNGLEVLTLLYLFPFLFHVGSERYCNTEVVRSSAALNSVGKEIM
jgi:hypothetical protein